MLPLAPVSFPRVVSPEQPPALIPRPAASAHLELARRERQLTHWLREARARIAPRPIGQRTFRRAATLTPASSEEEGEASSGDFEESEDLTADAEA